MRAVTETCRCGHLLELHDLIAGDEPDEAGPCRECGCDGFDVVVPGQLDILAADELDLDP